MAVILSSPYTRYRTAAYQYIRTTDRLPSVAEASAETNPQLKVKLFGGGMTCWIAGFDHASCLGWGVWRLFETEVGSLDLVEIVSLLMPPLRLPIERDLSFAPIGLAELLAGLPR